MRSHSVTFHFSVVNLPHLNPKQTVLRKRNASIVKNAMKTLEETTEAQKHIYGNARHNCAKTHNTC